ncbi:MAG TPA: hypothetical protein CFH81_06945 [Sulfurovum sp. UBA12169]|nr:MAG TPA: hypothetical protein CFH81_06945 [Sulfurovum sp. UBA12169]
MTTKTKIRWTIKTIIFLGFVLVLLNVFNTIKEGYKESVKEERLKMVRERESKRKAETEKQEKEKIIAPLKKDFLAHMKEKEKIVQDAIWNGDRYFYVAVYDDGSNRNGYAEYVCQVAYEKGLRGEKIYVKVVDYTKVLQNQGFVKLGEAFCE